MEQGGLLMHDQVGQEVLERSHGLSDWVEWGWSLLQTRKGNGAGQEVEQGLVCRALSQEEALWWPGQPPVSFRPGQSCDGPWAHS